MTSMWDEKQDKRKEEQEDRREEEGLCRGDPCKCQMFYHHDRPDNHGDFWGAIWGKMMIVQGWSWSFQMIMTVPHDPALQTTWSSISLSWWWSSSPSNRVLSKAEKGSIVEFRMGKINKCTASYSVVLSAPKSKDLIEEGNILGIEERKKKKTK